MNRLRHGQTPAEPETRSLACIRACRYPSASLPGGMPDKRVYCGEVSEWLCEDGLELCIRSNVSRVRQICLEQIWTAAGWPRTPVRGEAQDEPNNSAVELAGKSMRRGVRVVEGARLESVYTVKRIAGSNPALSASFD